jgi:hypothetical protein
MMTLLKTVIRKNDSIYRIAQAVKWGMRSNSEIVAHLAQFAPNSAGSISGRADIAMISAQQTFPLICELLTSVGKAPTNIKVLESNYAIRKPGNSAEQLAGLFKKYGSDKASYHNCHLLYGKVLEDRRFEPLNVLEIGLGTNNTDIVSHMGEEGQPGASLRAFRDFLPNAQICGADVDKRILFQEDRIETYFVDQTSTESLKELELTLSHRKFDLVIDDGLHCPSANIATLIFALKNLKSGGWFVIEDISRASLPVWHAILAILPSKYTSSILDGRNGFLFVTQNCS